jgi:PAS domain S-box-containing protein
VKKTEKERVKAVVEEVTLIDIIPDNLIVCDLNARILMINRAMRNHLAKRGINSEELIGKKVSEVIPFVRREDAEKYAKLIEEAVVKEKAGPIEVIGREGRWFSIVAARLRDAEGNPTGFLTIGRDITELKRAEEERIKAAAHEARLEEIEKAKEATEEKAAALERVKKELEEKIKELEEFHELAVGRELKMREMEEELERLRAKLGKRE